MPLSLLGSPNVLVIGPRIGERAFSIFFCFAEAPNMFAMPREKSRRVSILPCEKRRVGYNTEYEPSTDRE